MQNNDENPFEPEFEQNMEGIDQAGDAKMAKAYKLSSALVRDRLSQESEEDLTLLDGTLEDDVISIDGTYDHIHNVLKLTGIPFKRIRMEQLDQIKLRPDQTVFVNCGGSFPASGIRKLVTFVNQGGQLITTDWALKHVLEPAFPDKVRFNGKSTADEVVRIELVDREDPVVKGFLDEEADPVWWLEGSSYPIQILDKEKVKVMIRSKELGDKYGDDAVVVKFNVGDGVVYHMISHFYLQRTETRDKKQEMAADMYAASKGASAGVGAMFAAEEDMDWGTVQSASTSAEFVTRSIIEQKKRAKKFGFGKK
ncbi:MAG: hypothetical protein ACXAE3_08730 [Candidatus Kariarchaeaceae archaeon]|jgi:hypothetical protein